MKSTTPAQIALDAVALQLAEVGTMLDTVPMDGLQLMDAYELLRLRMRMMNLSKAFRDTIEDFRRRQERREF